MTRRLDGIELASYVSHHWAHINIIVASGNIRPAEGTLPANAKFLNKLISQEMVLEALKELG